MNQLSRLLKHGAGVAAAATALSACTSAAPVFDREFGNAVRMTAQQQVRNPDASRANAGRAVDGIDGRAGREAVDRYYRSFSEPPRTSNPFVIGLGGTGGESGGGGGDR